MAVKLKSDRIKIAVGVAVIAGIIQKVDEFRLNRKAVIPEENALLLLFLLRRDDTHGRGIRGVSSEAFQGIDIALMEASTLQKMMVFAVKKIKNVGRF